MSRYFVTGRMSVAYLCRYLLLVAVCRSLLEFLDATIPFVVLEFPAAVLLFVEFFNSCKNFCIYLKPSHEIYRKYREILHIFSPSNLVLF